MNLLPQVRPRRRTLSGPGRLFTLGVVAALVVVEILGRFSPSDLTDALAAGLLASLIGGIIAWHRRDPLPWVARLTHLGRRLGRWFTRYDLSVAIDLRGTPDIRRGLPPIGVAILLGLVLLGVAGLASALLLPAGVQPWARHIWYTGYLAALVGLWAAVALVGLLAILSVPALLYDDHLLQQAHSPHTAPKPPPFRPVLLYFAGLVVAAMVLPLSAFVIASWLAWGLALGSQLLPAGGPYAYVWRRKRGGPVRSVSWTTWSALEMTALLLVVTDLVLLSCGPAVFGRDVIAAAPLTYGLGYLMAVLAPGALLAWVWFQVVVPRWRDPGRPIAPLLQVAGAEPAVVGKALAGTPWRITADPQSDAAVGIAVVPPERSMADEFDPRWPLPVSLEDLAQPNLRDRLIRRDEIQQRRRFFTGLERLWKLAARSKGRGGHGFIFAPHLWFVPGLTRDGQDDDRMDGPMIVPVIGPSYHQLFGPACRHHLYRMLRALEVDVIYVEDGVTYARLRRVLRKLFEVYDRHAGQRRAEEAQFSGLNGTRVLMHEFTLEEPFRSTNYPEPKFDMLAGRARVLMVFRDRGEQDEELDIPFDVTTSPAPSMALV